jgi:hypothetical protein
MQQRGVQAEFSSADRCITRRLTTRGCGIQAIGKRNSPAGDICEVASALRARDLYVNTMPAYKNFLAIG